MKERGKLNILEKVDHQCSTCFKHEDEYHCIIECQRYNEWRQLYLPESLYVDPSMFKLMRFLYNIKGK